jgi:hypothetical protein
MRPVRSVPPFSGLRIRPPPTITDRNNRARPVVVFPEVSMVAVIGNVIAGLLALSLFTATIRLSK